MGNIREPIKKNSIEKKKKIIEKGFELMCNNGYHNVNCVDIAHYAGVSTGIIYQYFKDKRDIFIAGIKMYAEKITFPMLNVMEQEEITRENIKNLIGIMIDKFVETHTISEKAHEELMAMSCLDEEIAEIFYNYEIEITNKVSNILTKAGNVKGDCLQGLIDASKASIQASKKVAELQNYRVGMCQDLDPNSDTYGATMWGSTGFFCADKRTIDNKDWNGYGFKLENVEKLENIEVCGKLSFWEFDYPQICGKRKEV